MEYAKQGFADPDDAPDTNGQGKIVGSGGGNKGIKGTKQKDTKDTSDKSDGSEKGEDKVKGSGKSKAMPDYNTNVIKNPNHHHHVDNVMTILVFIVFIIVGLGSCCCGLYIGNRMKMHYLKEEQMLPQ